MMNTRHLFIIVLGLAACLGALADGRSERNRALSLRRITSENPYSQAAALR